MTHIWDVKILPGTDILEFEQSWSRRTTLIKASSVELSNKRSIRDAFDWDSETFCGNRLYRNTDLLTKINFTTYAIKKALIRNHPCEYFNLPGEDQSNIPSCS